MAFINRVVRILQADIHAVLERAELPERQLALAVSQMEDVLSNIEKWLHEQHHQQTKLSHRKSVVEALISRYDEEIDSCFGANSHHLARSFIRRKLASAAEYDELVQQLSQLQTDMTSTEEKLTHYRRLYDSMREKSELLWQDYELHQGYAENHFNIEKKLCHRNDDDVELAYIVAQKKYAAAMNTDIDIDVENDNKQGNCHV